MDRNVRQAPASWASGINALLGLWLIISPWIVRFPDHPTALWNTLILGIVVLIAALYATRATEPGPSWANVVFGVWLIIAPWVLGFSALEGATTNSVVLGIIVGILGLCAGLAKSSPSRRMPAA
jgi:hypothetical protein